MFNRHSHSEGAALKDVNAPAENLAGKKDMALVSPLRFINHKHKIHTILSQYGISNFDKNKLKHAETVEKNSLPTAEDIEASKKEDDTE